MNKTGIDEHTTKSPDDIEGGKCPGCGGRSFVECKRVQEGRTLDIWVCKQCGHQIYRHE